MADIDLQLDMGPMNRAMHLAESWSESTPIFLAVRTAQRIVTKANEYTPAVSVGQIDSELDVAYFPGKTPKTGKPSKQAKNAIPLFGNEQDAGSERSLAFLIQLARMAPGSNYNALTSNRWRLPAGFEMLKGLDATGRVSVLQDLAARMVKARHSSIAFLKSGWASAGKKVYNLRGFLKRGADGDAATESILEAGFSDKSVAPKPNMSFVTFSSTDTSASCTVQNRIGMEDAQVNGSNAENYNKAMHDRGLPALQRAVDDVAAEMV